jgi:hypothetical protein
MASFSYVIRKTFGPLRCLKTGKWFKDKHGMRRLKLMQTKKEVIA